MILARIVGTVVSTRKDPRLEGKKLLIVKPVNPEGADEAGGGGHLRAGALQAGERLLLAGREAVRLGEQDAGCPAG